MAISLKSTREQNTDRGRTILIYGPSGTGKTLMAASLASPVILDAENKLATLTGRHPITGEEIRELPFASVSTLAQVWESVQEFDRNEDFDSVFVDSLSEVAALELVQALKRHKNGMQAYGEIGDKVFELVRRLREPRRIHVVLVCRVSKTQDETGKILWGPDMPGKAIGPALPHYFEHVLAARAETSGDKKVYGLLTSSDSSWIANDCSRTLDQWEAPDLGAIINKITGQG